MHALFKKSWVTAILLWIGISVLAIYIRCYPSWGHIWAPTHEVATMAVVYKLKQTLLAQVHAQYPQMPIEEASQIATAKLNDTLRKEKSNLARAIERTNDSLFKQGRLPNNIYLLEADPFYFYNLTENILNHGKMADTIKGHQYFNTFMVAPFGFWQPLSLHPYVGFTVYKAAQIFSPTIKLIEAVAFTPLVLTVFAIAAFIWCARLFGLSYPFVGISCLYFAMLPVFLKRSALGWYDTDPYNVLFTILYLIIMFKVAMTAKLRNLIVLACALSITLLLFSLIWQGWVFLFFMSFIAVFAIGAYKFFIQKDTASAQQLGVFIATFIGTIVIAGVMIYGFNGFFTFFTEGSSELEKFTNKGLNLWPNLFMEVGELKKSSLQDILGDTGGPLFLILSFIGAIFATIGIIKNRRHQEHVKHLLVLIFLLITTVLTLKATRFVIFMLIPLSLLFGFGLQSISAKLQGWPKLHIIRGVLALALIGWCWVEANASIRTVLTPIFNDVWNDNLSALKLKTPGDAIINAWWPPGHFIKAIAHRRVMFDGASLGEGQTGYWMAKTFLSNDEKEARGILRMLNLSGNKATEFLTNQGLKTSDAVNILTMIASQSINEARANLHNVLNPKDTESLLSLTHGPMPHSYLLVYNEMIEQNIGLVFVGRRNFEKIENINTNPKLLANIPPQGSKEFIEYLWDIAGGPSKFSEQFAMVNKTDAGMFFAPGLFVSADYKNAIMNSAQYGHGTPQSIVYAKDGQIVEAKMPGGTLPYSIVLYEQDRQLMCRLMDTSLANSLMMKLYFFDGQGMKYFKIVKSSTDLTGRTQIKTFQVN